MAYGIFENVHQVDVSPEIGGDLFTILDTAWQVALADTGDKFERRYDGLEGIGLALMTATDRRPIPGGSDNPLGLVPGAEVPRANLIERGTEPAPQPGVGTLRYRSNHQHGDAQLDVSLLGVDNPEEVDELVLANGRYAINAAAKRFYLLNNAHSTTSHNPDGPRTGTRGELGAAGGLRLPEGLGIVSISGGNQAHDHIGGQIYSWMARDIIAEHTERGQKLEQVQLDDYESLAITTMVNLVEATRTFVRREFSRRLDELEHSEYGRVLTEIDHYFED